MAVGDATTVTDDGAIAIELLATATATNGVPSGASAGLAVSTIEAALTRVPPELTLSVYSNAGSGSMSATLRLWFYDPVAADWFPAGTGTDALKGVINAGAAIGETSADKIRHMEPVWFPWHVSRVYLEIVAIAGTATALKANLIGRRVA